jgi:hypothetical protein
MGSEHGRGGGGGGGQEQGAGSDADKDKRDPVLKTIGHRMQRVSQQMSQQIHNFATLLHKTQKLAPTHKEHTHLGHTAA